MRILILSLATLAIGGCNTASGEAEAAERQYAMLQKNGGSEAELCEAARKVEQAWLKAENAEKHKLSKITADSSCLLARVRGS
jgi:hypothetical protein